MMKLQLILITDLLKMDKSTQNYSYQDLFGYLNKADTIVSLLAERVIAFVGLTRAGKSATLNSIVNPNSLIGKKDKINIFYQPTNQKDPNFASIGHTLSSVTIMANVRKYLQNGRQINLVDLGGLGQKRQGMLVLVVNYMLAYFLKNVKQIKFVLVMAYKDFTNISGNNFRDTFLQFLNLFDFNNMSNQHIQGLFSSVSLYITSYDINQIDSLYDNLQQMRKYLKELYQKNNEYMPNYLICERLVNHLIKNRRVDYFLLAKKDKSPSKNLLIQEFNKKNWTYFEIFKIKPLIKYPYMKQFQMFLTENQQKYLISKIYQRFDELKIFKNVFKSILMKVKDNLCQKQIDFSEQIEELNNIFIKNNFYEDLKFIKVKEQIKVLSVVQKIKNLSQIIKITYQFQLFDQWKHKNQDIQNSNYLQNYSKEYFIRLINLILQIVGHSPRNYQIIKKLSLILQKLFKEAAVLYQLQTKNNENPSLKSDLKLVIKDNMVMDDFVMQKQIKMQLIEQLRTKQFTTQSFSNIQIQEILELIRQIEGKYQEINPTFFYQIRIKLNILKAEQSQVNFNPTKNHKIISLSNYLNAFKETIFFITCMQNSLEYQEQQEYQKIRRIQKNILTNCFKILFELTYSSKALEICTQLKLHSHKTEIYMRMLKFQKQPYSRVYQVAKHYKSIGMIDQSQTYFKMLLAKQRNSQRPAGFKDPRIQLDEIRKNRNSYDTLKTKCSRQENEVINGKKSLQKINEIKRSILKQPQQFYDLVQIKNNYDRKMKKIMNNNEGDKQDPDNPTNQELISLSKKKIQFVKNKKITVLIGNKNQCGLTTFGYALTNQKFKITNDGNYELQNERFKGKINHRQNHQKGKQIKNEFPNIIHLNQDQCIIDIPRIFDFTPDKVVIKAYLMQCFIFNSSHFRLILVCKQQDLLFGQAKQFIKMLVFIMKSFKLVQKNSESYKTAQFCSIIVQSIAIGITFVENIPKIKNAIKQIIENLKNQTKTIENEKNYNIVEFQQRFLADILQKINKKSKFINFNKPQVGIKNKQSFKYMEDLCKKEQKSHFDYIQTRSYLDHNQLQISYKIMSNFNNSEQQKIIVRMQMLFKFSLELIQKVTRILYSSLKKFMSKQQIYQSIQCENFQQLQKIGEISNSKLRLLRQQGNYVPQGQILVQYQDQDSKLAKKLKIIQKLLQITSIDFAEQLDKMLPYQYGELFRSFQALIAQKYINSTSELICHNDYEVQTIYRTKLMLLNIFTELQVYGQSIKTWSSEGMDDSKALKAIAQTMGDVIRIKDVSVQLVASSSQEILQYLFSTFHFTDMLSQDKDPDIQERCYKHYSSILNIWNEKKYQFKVRNIQMNRLQLNINYAQLMGALKDYYKRHEKTVDYVITLIDMCLWNYQKDEEVRQNTSLSQSSSIRSDYQNDRILKEICMLLVKMLPLRSQQFAKIIGDNELIDQMYDRIYNHQQKAQEKIKILQRHLYFLGQMGKEQRIKDVYQKLKIIISPTSQRFATINRYLNQRKQTRRVQRSRQPRIASTQTIIKHLRDAKDQLQKTL